MLSKRLLCILNYNETPVQAFTPPAEFCLDILVEYKGLIDV